MNISSDELKLRGHVPPLCLSKAVKKFKSPSVALFQRGRMEDERKGMLCKRLGVLLFRLEFPSLKNRLKKRG
jgi:hypothetical protein